MINPAHRISPAKVKHDGIAPLVDEDVVGLDVAPEDAQAVQPCDGLLDLARPLLPEGRRRFAWWDSAVFDAGEEGAEAVVLVGDVGEEDADYTEVGGDES